MEGLDANVRCIPSLEGGYTRLSPRVDHAVGKHAGVQRDERVAPKQLV